MNQLKFFSLALLCALLQTTAFSQSQNAGKTVTDYFAWVDAGNLDAVGALLTDDFNATAPFAPAPFSKMTWREVGQGFKTAFPDMKHEVVDWFASGNKVAVKGNFRGTNTGPNMGNPATGNKVDCAFNALFELDGKGRIKSLNTQFDMKSFEMQLMAGLPDPKQQAEADVRAMLAAADAGDVEKFMGYWAADGVNYFAGKQTSGEDMKKRIAAFKTAFPDIQRTLDDVIVAGNTVTVRGWVTGTNRGVFQGKAPSGNSVKIAWLGLYKLNAAGKIESGWVEFDSKTLDAQVAGGNNKNSKAAAESMMAELNKGNLDGVLAHCAADARFHGWGPQPLDAAGYRQAMSDIFASFPDARFPVLDVVADGDKVVVRHQLEGTHTGTAFQGIGKSDRKVVVPATVIFRFRDGKATELWLNADMLGLLLQLGANPMAGK